jgi:hypothetical protein
MGDISAQAWSGGQLVEDEDGDEDEDEDEDGDEDAATYPDGA